MASGILSLSFCFFKDTIFHPVSFFSCHIWWRIEQIQKLAITQEFFAWPNTEKHFSQKEKFLYFGRNMLSGASHFGGKRNVSFSLIKSKRSVTIVFHVWLSKVPIRAFKYRVPLCMQFNKTEESTVKEQKRMVTGTKTEGNRNKNKVTGTY